MYQMLDYIYHLKTFFHTMFYFIYIILKWALFCKIRAFLYNIRTSLPWTPPSFWAFFSLFLWKYISLRAFKYISWKNHWGLYLEVGCSSDLKQPLISHLMFQNNWKARWNYFNLFSFSYNLTLVIVSEGKTFLSDKTVTPLVDVQWLTVNPRPR